jgi:MYXO-CTERM domain-containing protein
MRSTFAASIACVFLSVPGAAFGSLFGIAGSDLVELDAATGQATIVGNTGRTGISTLTYNTASESLIGYIATSRTLVEIDPITGDTQTLFSYQASSVTANNITAIEYNPDTNQLFAVRRPVGSLLGSLFVIDLATGDFVNPTTSLGGFEYSAIAYVPSLAAFLGYDDNDTATLRTVGAGPAFEKSPGLSLTSLAFDSDADVLYAYAIGSGLSVVDLDTGIATPVSAGGFSVVSSLAFVPVPSPGALAVFGLCAGGMTRRRRARGS